MCEKNRRIALERIIRGGTRQTFFKVLHSGRNRTDFTTRAVHRKRYRSTKLIVSLQTGNSPGIRHLPKGLRTRKVRIMSPSQLFHLTTGINFESRQVLILVHKSLYHLNAGP
jgi:hypothetical protein